MDLELPRGKFRQWHRHLICHPSSGWVIWWGIGLQGGVPRRLTEGGAGRDCLFSNDVTLDLLKQLAEPYFQANSDLLVECFQSSYPALLVEFQLCGQFFLLCQVLCIVLKLKQGDTARGKRELISKLDVCVSCMCLLRKT